MSLLRIKPQGNKGKTHDISVEKARTALSPNWSYVGFGLYKLAEGASCHEFTHNREVILVLIEGKAKVQAQGETFAQIDFSVMGDRMSVFEKSPPHCAYIPQNAQWRAQALSDCTLAVCSAPALEGSAYPAQSLGPEGITQITRGKGANKRRIHNIAMEERDVASALLVTEVFTPDGNWSSYPPHRHDEDDFPRMTYLEETYYHRINPAQGYGIQRVFSEDGALDETIAVKNEDVVLVPQGHHPCGVPYGYEMYYLNVMAGPRRNWRFQNHPDHHWIYERDQ